MEGPRPFKLHPVAGISNGLHLHKTGTAAQHRLDLLRLPSVVAVVLTVEHMHRTAHLQQGLGRTVGARHAPMRQAVALGIELLQLARQQRDRGLMVQHDFTQIVGVRRQPLGRRL